MVKSGFLKNGILRMLRLFGLLEADREPKSAVRFLSSRRYRKTSLFGRFFAFDVRLEPTEEDRHSAERGYERPV
jgi:hypothetical protein